MAKKSQKTDQTSQEFSEALDNELEISIGSEVRGFRKAMGLTVAELAKLSGFSIGMLSKIENGLSSPSLSTLKSLSQALNVPVTAFFRKYEEERVASFVPAGSGLLIERRGTRSGHQYQLLGHNANKHVALNPYLITLTEESDIFPLFQHSGQEFLYMLEGVVTYRHGDKTYLLKPGDALLFDSDAPHGPEELNQVPIRFLSIISYARNAD